MVISKNSIINIAIAGLVCFNLFLGNKLQVRALSYVQVKFFDIGQGDSLLISTPDQADILVDTGREPKIIDDLGNTLGEGNKLEAMLLTHWDDDHMGMSAEIIEKYRPETIFINGSSKTNDKVKKVRDDIAKYVQNIVIVNHVQSWRLGCCSIIDLLWPANNNFSVEDENENSIAAVFTYKNFQMFMAGDLPTDHEDELARNFDLSGVDVLKVGHHGSHTSTSAFFVGELNPDVAVISVGKGNKYGHPHADTLKNLEGREVHRTDEEGEIRLITDGEEFKLLQKNNADY
jgi:competence protein ComEC